MSEIRAIDADKLMAMFRYPIDYSAVYVRKMIDAAPTIDAVRHARWERTSPASWECSDCRAAFRWNPERPKARYCHGCGARMDAEEEKDG